MHARIASNASLSPGTLSAGRTDIGRRRQQNEDSFLCDDALGLYVVADGVGGHAKGEVASAESVDLVHCWVRRWREALLRHRAAPNAEAAALVRRLLEAAVQSACYMVFGMGMVDPRQRGMSTTVSALLVSGPIAFVAHVGDSRVYRARGGKVEQLTEDHTLVNWQVKHGILTPQEAVRAPGKNIITRAVGQREYVEVDIIDLDARAGDRFMLCSDGLHGYLRDGEVDTLIRGDRAQVAQRLIDLANDRGGRDNVTVVVCDVV